jgi:endonuclease/exonuclease/phosphatase family metal-dependent hydrolase
LQFHEMNAGIGRIRMATYNVHKCRGMDCRVRPQRIVEVLQEIDADIIALQEVVSTGGHNPKEDQAGFITRSMGMWSYMGVTRRLNGGAYGNLILSRYPLGTACNYDISTNGRERRGCVRVDLELSGSTLLHIFNVHLGTAYLERRQQARMLLTSNVLNNRKLRGVRIVLGDFNEWTRGLATRLLNAQFESVDVQRCPRRTRTYPGILPLLHLDHIYFDPTLTVEHRYLHRSRAALIASDHLPLVADFRMPPVL